MIYTFYSYKGGVGRSMAVANVARALTLQGIAVAIVDWDLEAPGLESFFCRSDEERERVRQELGLIDLLTAYKAQSRSLNLPPDSESVAEAVAILEAELPPLSTCLVPLEASTASAPILLLTAGWRAGDRFADYAHAVQSFDWNDFYVRYHGEAYFEWLRRQLLAAAPVALIDSRTGVTEMGGVCTRQLADVIVSFCVPNVQNLGGVADMAASFVRSDIVDRRGRDLDLVVVPTRIDGSEIESRNQFHAAFDQALQRYTPVAFHRHKREFWDLKIPYIPRYAYQETLAVGEPDAAEELATAYTVLTAHLALLGMARVPALERVWDGFWRSVSAPLPGTNIVSFFNVPRQRNPHFGGREDVLAEISAGFEKSGVVALHGLAGCGKTEVAVEFAYRHSTDFDVVWFVGSHTPDDLESGYRALAEALGLDPAGLPAPSVRRWLERTERWLLILDDARGPAELDEYLPRKGLGRVIVTTRNANWGKFAYPVHVGALDRGESVSFLLERVREGDSDAAGELASVLGDLPLALELAAAYVETSGQSLREYVQLLADHGGELLARGSDATDANLGAVFESAIRELSAESLPAANLLTLAAFLAPVELQPELVAYASSGLEVEPLRALSDRLTLNEAITVLRRHSLVEQDGRWIKFHPVVQALRREQVPPPERPMWAAAALYLAGKMLEAAVETVSRPVAAALLEHGFEAVANAAGAEETHALARWVLERAATVAFDAYAESDAERAYACRRVSIGLTTIGELDAAEIAIQQALAIDSAGDDTEALLQDCTQLSDVLLRQGRTDEAQKWADRALQMMTGSYGADDPRTLGFRLAVGRAIAKSRSQAPEPA